MHAPEPSFRAAFGKFDYTPPPGGALGRLAINVMAAKGAFSALHARMALFESNDQRAAIVTLDQGMLNTEVVSTIRKAIEQGAGVPPDRCMVCCTHTHNAPAMLPWRPEDRAFELVDHVSARLQMLAATLVTALEPVTLKYSEAEVPGWAFNRRPLYQRAGGDLAAATHGPREGDNYVRMEGSDENTISSIHAITERGKCAGGLVSYACHPTCMYGEAVWSADFPGVLMERVESSLGGNWLYLSAPAGDISQLMPGQRRQGPAYCTEMGSALASAVIAALPTAEVIGTDSIRVGRVHLPIAQRRVTAAQLQTARDHLSQKEWKTNGGRLSQLLFGYEYHFHPSVHQGGAVIDDWLAEEIVGMWEWQRRAGARENIEQVEVQAVVLGNMVLIGFPCELFAEPGRAVRQASPFGRCIVVQLANGWHGYVPTQAAFHHGGYECCLGYQSRLEPGAATALVAAASRLLNELAREGSPLRAPAHPFTD